MVDNIEYISLHLRVVGENKTKGVFEEKTFFLFKLQKLDNLLLFCYRLFIFLKFLSFLWIFKSWHGILINLMEFFKKEKALVLVNKGVILHAASQQRLGIIIPFPVPQVQLCKHSFMKGLFLAQWFCSHWVLFSSVSVRQHAPCWDDAKLQLDFAPHSL